MSATDPELTRARKALDEAVIDLYRALYRYTDHLKDNADAIPKADVRLMGAVVIHPAVQRRLDQAATRSKPLSTKGLTANTGT